MRKQTKPKDATAISDVLEPLTQRQLLESRRQAYARIFDGIDGDIVKKDLARFCRANESTFHADARLHAVLEGRREVWLRIQDHLDLTQEELELRYGVN